MTTGEFELWAASQLTRDDASGELGRALPGVVGWFAPGVVETHSDELRWAHGIAGQAMVHGAENNFGIVTMRPELLGEFVDLATASAKGIATFARANGVLTDVNDETISMEGREPIAAWRRLAGDARTALTIAARLHSDEPVPDEDWARFETFSAHALPAPSEMIDTIWLPHTGAGWLRWPTGNSGMVGQPRAVIAQFISAWVATAPPGLDFDWWAEPALVMRPRGLFSAIGLQLAYAVARSRDLALCSECVAPYFPRRRPSARRRNYCESCRQRGVPQRDAQRDRRARLRR